MSLNANIENQKKALDKLSKLRAGALFMEAGTGKTKVACDLIISKIDDIDKIIWIAPASLIRDESYKNEIAKWIGLYYDMIVFFTIESISASDKKYFEIREIADKTSNFCVIDESMTIKNITANRTQRILAMANKFNYRLILNGTPTARSLLDLYSQINFLSPLILNMTEKQFAHNFLQFKKNGEASWRVWSKPANEMALVEILRPYIFDSSLDVDVNVRQLNNTFELNQQENSNYSDVKQRFFEKQEEDEDLKFLEMAQIFQKTYTLCESKKRQLLQNIKEIKQVEGKVIIYVKFLIEVDFLKNAFDTEGYKYLIMTGDYKDENVVERLRSKDADILICTYGVGSRGLNLQFCQNIIFFSQSFSWGDKEQAFHRIYRIGQKDTIHIYNYWVSTGLENIIKESLEKKECLSANLKKIIEKKDLINKL